ncbi:hypothetical protein DKP76_07275 [Falsochrobactrum shanghaiense]|uniref:DUF669 domain-containing protein n=1 Tax=Falsochrobactrum shanghaiense TaxID=2201899 RepID=A0A316JE22_9HYPH|nr:DUF669 domain-containing protein [Falsochrobactrum shanghaiense]PWL18855.1 hypothetical protein DKP76_07275 [Falsochrobactrum shanghaiense]
MAKLATRFNATDHDTTQSDYAELPNGTYVMEVEAADVAATSTGSGTILKTTMKVLEPQEQEGRKLFTNYNIENKNPQAQEIGQRQLASLCRAIGVSAVDDTEDLLFKSFTARVALGRPSKDGQYPARAEIKRYYYPDEGNVPPAEIDATQPTAPRPANDNRPAAANSNQPAAAAEGKKRPWG